MASRPEPAPAGADSSASAQPLFVQIKLRLRQDILEKRLLAGQKLPSEAALQKAFGVSRITVRQALSDLQAEGLIETLNGKGSFVTRPANAPRLGMLSGFNEILRAQGRTGTGRNLSVRTGPAPARVARALKLQPGAQVRIVRTIRFADGVPAALFRTFYEPTLGRDILAERIPDEDAMSLMEEELGFRLDRTQISASAVKAGCVRGRMLEVTPDTPLLHMRIVPHDLTGLALFYSDMYCRSDQFTYRTLLRR